MKQHPKTKLFIASLTAVALLPAVNTRGDDRLDGTWMGTEKVSLATRTDCPKPNYPTTLPAKIVIAGSLFGVVDGYGPGRYTSVQKSSSTLVF